MPSSTRDEGIGRRPPETHGPALAAVARYGRWQAVRRAALVVVVLTVASGVAELAESRGTDTVWGSELVRWLSLLLAVLVLRFTLLMAARAREAARAHAAAQDAGTARPGAAPERALFRGAAVPAVLLSVAVVGLHVAAESVAPDGGIAVLGRTALGLEAVLLVLGLAVLRRPRDLATWDADVRDVDLTVPPSPDGRGAASTDFPAVEPGRSAICLSGGGIRAAAFGLGGIQALTAEPRLHRGLRRIYAVSGGSYIAASLATLSSPEPGTPPRTAPPHDERPFQRGSAEEGRLRRNTFYLIGSPSTAVLGLLHIVYGLVLNLTLVLAALYVLAWWGGSTYGDLKLLAKLFPAPGAELGHAIDGVGPNFTRWVTVPLIALLVAVFVLFAAARVLERLRRPANPWSTALQRFSGVLASLAAGFAVVAFAVPLLITGLSDLTVGNRPTAGVAKVLFTLNGADVEACNAGLRQHLHQAREQALVEAEQDGTAPPRRVTYGACGTEYTALTRPPAPAAAPDDGYAGDARAVRGGQLTVAGDSSHVGGVMAFLAAVAALIQSLFRSVEKGRAAPWYQRLWARFRGVVLPWLAITVTGLAALLTLLVWTRMFAAAAEGADRNPPAAVPVPVLDEPWIAFWTVLGAVVAVHLLLDANRGSLYPFYRERLSQAFLVREQHDEQDDARRAWTRALDRAGHGSDAARRSQRRVGAIPVGEPADFDRFPGVPEVMICASANASDRGLIPARRGCVPFVFSREWMGVSDNSLPVPPRLLTSREYGRLEPDDTTLGAAIAISGAAFSPIMGRMSGRATAFRILMALGNARLGVWLRNPYWITAGEASPDRFRRFLGRPGIFRLLVEAAGRPSLLDGRLYVTDGGHFDNIALVEALRPKQRLTADGTTYEWEPMPAHVFVLDASADAENTFDTLAEAVATVRMDLGLTVELPDTARLESGPAPDGSGPDLAREAWLQARVKDRDGVDTGITVHVGKAIAFERMSRDLRSYLEHHPEFPRTSTTNQFYGEFDFEAYRHLGQLVGEGMLRTSPFAARHGHRILDVGADGGLDGADGADGAARPVPSTGPRILP